MSAVAEYRTLLRSSGSWLPAISFLARLPQAMGQMGTLLLVSATHHDLAVAGLVAGALSLGQAAAGPLVGHLADRHGQRRVLPVAATANAAATLGLVAAALAHRPTAVLLPLGVVAGVTVPQISSLARSRWVALIASTGADRGLLSTAFSLEGGIDETSFVIGPALVGVAASLASPALGLILAAVLVGVFGVAFGRHRTAPARHHAARRSALRPMMTPAFVELATAMLLQGVVFGTVQTGVAAFAERAGHAGSAGLIYAALGVTSALAGLATAALPGGVSLDVRLRVSTAAMVLLGLPLLFVGSIPALVAVMAGLGVTVGPYMITNFSVGERLVPADGLSAAMGVLTGGVVVGYAIGSSVGGATATAHGPTGTFILTCAAMVLALLVALIRGTDRSHTTVVDAHSGNGTNTRRT